MLIGLLGIMGVFVVQLFYLQVIRHGYYVAEAEKIQLTSETILPERGMVYALDGDTPVPLVMNETVYTVFADPQAVEDIPAITATLSEVAGGNVVDGYEANLGSEELRYVPMAKQVTRAQAELIREKELAGVGMQEATRRVYPEGQLASQLLGFVNATEEGQYGLEGALHSRLSGTPGLLETVSDVRRIPLTIGDDDVRVPAVDGDDIVLTIDRAVQAYAEQVLKEGLDNAKATNGSIVVMDPDDGSVKAMANYPTYNPSQYTKVDDQGVFQNKVVSFPFETGSVIKTLTMGAGLDSGAVTTSSTFDNTGCVDIDGTTICNVEEDPIYPGTTMTDILQYSLNTGVVHILQQMGGGNVNAQARETLHNYFTDNYRFGKLTGIEQANESAGTVISPDDPNGANIRYANMTFGQGMDLTMIQTVGAFSATINGGTYHQPHLVGGTRQADGSLQQDQHKVLRDNVVSAQTSAQLRNMIYEGRKRGFFGDVDPAGYIVGGKTGTSQVIDPETGAYTDENSIGTYLGFGGVERPEYVIMVRVQDSKIPGYAGTTAAGPIFNDMSNWMINHLRLEPKE